MQKRLRILENQDIFLPILWTGEHANIMYDIQLLGRGASITILAMLLGNDSKKIDLQTTINHKNKDTKSRIIVRGAVTDNACIDFNGLTKIESGATGTNAWLGAHLLLLSDNARGKVVPGLEIAENDIKAGHATTVGRVNDLELFYLISRGISKNSAISLIIRGFLENIIRDFPNALRLQAEKKLNEFTQHEEST